MGKAVALRPRSQDLSLHDPLPVAESGKGAIMWASGVVHVKVLVKVVGLTIYDSGRIEPG